MSNADNQVSDNHADELKRGMGAIVDTVASNNTSQKTEENSLADLAAYLRENSDLSDNQEFDIQLGSRKVYRNRDGNEQLKPLTSAEAAKVSELLKGNAIKGSFRVYTDEASPAFQIKSGQEVINKINFAYAKQAEKQKTAQSQAKEAPKPTPAKVEASEKKGEIGLEETVEFLESKLEEAMKALKDATDRLEAVEKRQDVQLANPRLSDWMRGVKNRYTANLQQKKNNFTQKMNDLRDKVTAKKEGVEQKVNDKFQEGKQAVTNRVQEGKQTVTDRVQKGKQTVTDTVQKGKQQIAQQWLKKVVEPSLTAIVDKFGAGKEFQTQDYTISREGDSGLRIARNSDGTEVTPENMNQRDQKVLQGLSDQGQKLTQGKPDQTMKTPQVKKAVKPKM